MTNNELYDVFLEVVKQRRSVRYLKPDPIPDEYITKIIEAARWAPSGFHTQPWEFVVVKKKETRDKIADILEPPIPKIVRSLEEMVHYDDCGPADFRTTEQVESCARETYAWCLSAH